MTNDKPRGSIFRSARLPAMLLVVLLAAISGSVLWLTLAPPPEETALAPTAKIELAPADIPDNTAPPPRGAVMNAPPNPVAPAPETAMAETSPAAAPMADKPSVEAEPEAAPMTPPASPTPKEPAAETKPPAVAGDDATMAPPLTPTIPKLPPPPPSAPLPRAPDPALVEESKSGPLPIVGRDGREAWRVYARPFNRDDDRPKIAVVLYGLGSSAAATRTAIQGLPGAVSLAFSPYANGLRDWVADARAAGHEALLMVPMEPINFPTHDPGPQALLTSLSAEQNTGRLEWILGRTVGYVGVTDFMGSRFSNSIPHMRIFLKQLKTRGLMYLESNTASRLVAGEIAHANRLPFVPNALYLDSQASRQAIDAQLAEAERLARKLGQVAVMGFLYPVTLERVAVWSRTIEKRGLALAPVSAIANRR